METIYYIGLDIHKKVTAYCIKELDGHLVEQGKIGADRTSVGEWVNGLPGPWICAMEATIFTGWTYDFLTPFAVDLKVAHPEMLKTITAAFYRFLFIKIAIWCPLFSTYPTLESI